MALGEYSAFGTAFDEGSAGSFQGNLNPLDNYMAEKLLGTDKNGVPYYALKRQDGGWDYFKGEFGKGEMKISESDAAKELQAVGDVPQRGDVPQSFDYSAGGGAGSEANFDVIDGIQYDLNDPGQFQSYIQKANEKLNASFEMFRTNTQNIKEEDIAEAKAQEERTIFNIEKALQRLGEQEGQYNTDWTRSVQDLAEGYRQGSARRQTFYAAAAPRVYQSSQGTSQNYAENKWKEGETRYNEDKANTMKEFGRAREDYGRSKIETQNQFNLFKSRREREAQDAVFNQAQQTQQQRDSMMAKTKNWSANTGNFGSSKWGGVNFNEQDLSGYTPSKVNLNDLMSFIKFQPQGQMGLPGISGKVQSAPAPESGSQSLNMYKGYAPQEEEESTLNLYKSGRSY